MIPLPAATEELVRGNRDSVLGHVGHEIGMSVLISKCCFITGLVGNTDLERKLSLQETSPWIRGEDRAGITSQELVF